MSRSHSRWIRTAPGAALLLTLFGGAGAGVAQTPDAPPSRIVEVELERSRSCVTTLAAVAELDAVLDPLAQRSRRLLNIADAEQVMPPKSTWFEPKLRDGLFVHVLD